MDPISYQFMDFEKLIFPLYEDKDRKKNKSIQSSPLWTKRYMCWKTITQIGM